MGHKQMNILAEISIEDFLNKYWEQKPLVIRGSIKQPDQVISKDDLYMMACDEYYESRIISFDSGIWDIQDGPFESSELKPQSEKFTLVNHNVNLYNENIHKLQRELEFLPSWLFDDAMTTLSTKGSSVGAHIDNYNVFITQLTGTRKWEIQYNPKKDFQKDLPVKILEEFTPDESFVLEPGDMIYIPPHVAHHGTSLDDSLSLSMGFKSIEYDELLKTLGMELINNLKDLSFYKTSFNNKISDSVQIDQFNLAEIKQNIHTLIDSEGFIENAILKFSSTSKKTEEAEPEEYSKSEFLDIFKERNLSFDEYMRISSIRLDNERYSVSINREIFTVSAEQYQQIMQLQKLLPQSEIHDEEFSQIKEILFRLTNMGICFFIE